MQAWEHAFIDRHGRLPLLVERVERNTELQRRGPLRQALAHLEARREARGEAITDAHMPDAAIKGMAQARADLLAREIASLQAGPVEVAAAWLLDRVRGLEARADDWPGRDRGQHPPAQWLAGMMARAQCALWWRRQLRRAVVRKREVLGIVRGEVRARAQLYCTDDTLTRRMLRQRDNRAMLEATEIESRDGDVITLAVAADKSTSNKAIRRGELMTRIRGCEEWAQAQGMAGLFTTNTVPSRFHPQLMAGGANPAYAGEALAGPRQAQQWLRNTWAKCRAALQRAGVPLYGFRVAEPHHDGCPHWHMLLWSKPEHVERLGQIMRAAWLADGGHEPGAQQYRVKLKALEAGGAAAYVAKYVAKNIDDEGSVAADGHHDEDHTGQGDWVGTGKAQRVEAWASAWGIRQFQALGQPPVTVWRELRRVDADAVRGAHPDVVAAHAAVQRLGDRRATWAGYLKAQGGAMTGRDYRIRIERTDDEPETGRYGEAMAPRIIGVVHVARPGVLVQSSRKQWRGRGLWAAADRAPWRVPGLGDGIRGARVNGQGGSGFVMPDASSGGAERRGRASLAVHPWPRVNNCTRQGGAAYLMGAGLVGVMRAESVCGSGAINNRSTKRERHHDPNPSECHR